MARDGIEPSTLRFSAGPGGERDQEEAKKALMLGHFRHPLSARFGRFCPWYTDRWQVDRDALRPHNPLRYLAPGHYRQSLTEEPTTVPMAG
jgi:hypothetical protein